MYNNDMETVLKRNLGFIHCSMYDIHSDGKVFSYKTKKFLKPTKNSCGYLRVVLYNDERKRVRYTIHRLVCMAFIPNQENKPHVNHKNTDINNNDISNLEWCTQKENNNNPITRKKRSEMFIGDKNPFYRKRHTDKVRSAIQYKNSIPIIQYTLDGKFVKEWKSSTEVNKVLGYDVGYIRKCCNGVYKNAYGFIWINKKEDD